MDIGRQNNSGGLVTCYITQPDKAVFNVDVDSKADGHEVLEKVCKRLAIIDEAEYFCLQFASAKGELLWLNTRNRLSKQMTTSPPYHLLFKVKYFVPPHTLLLEETRHQFYLNVAYQLELGLWYAETSSELQARLIALMAYIKHGPFNPQTTPCKYACFWPDILGEMPADIPRLAAIFHRELWETPMQQAEYELLRLVHLEVPAYGVYFYDVKDIFNRRLTIGVGPEFVSVCSSSTTFIERYPYDRIQTFTLANKVVTLNLLEDDGSVKPTHFQLSGSTVANSLYRSIMEMHCFFHCDVINENVITQTNRLASLFDHNYKEYIFDVRLTCREVYDRARRRLYHSANDAASGTSPQESGLECGVGLDPSAGNIWRITDTPTSQADSITSAEIQEKVEERLREAGECQVCKDNPINRVFFPCGHTICCDVCADRLDQCPICRKVIKMRHICFLPWNSESEAALGVASQHQKMFTRHRRSHNASIMSTESYASNMVFNENPLFRRTFTNISDTHSLPNLIPRTQPKSVAIASNTQVHNVDETNFEPISYGCTETVDFNVPCVEISGDPMNFFDLSEQFQGSVPNFEQRTRIASNEFQSSTTPLNPCLSREPNVESQPDDNRGGFGGNYFNFLIRRKKRNLSTSSTSNQPVNVTESLYPTSAALPQQSQTATSSILE